MASATMFMVNEPGINCCPQMMMPMAKRTSEQPASSSGRPTYMMSSIVVKARAPRRVWIVQLSLAISRLICSRVAIALAKIGARPGGLRAPALFMKKLLLLFLLVGTLAQAQGLTPEQLVDKAIAYAGDADAHGRAGPKRSETTYDEIQTNVDFPKDLFKFPG
ncbi:MAG: hypothetical protein ACR2ID_07015 [Chthoniobacterales bacterium]